MSENKTYSQTELCEELNISTHTLTHWYSLEAVQLKEGLITEKYLPEPIRISDRRGKPRVWTQEMVDALRTYQSKIVTGRNGIYGAYSNPNHKNTRKYQKMVDAK